MRKALLAALVVLAGVPAAAVAQVTISVPHNVQFSVGVPVTFNVTAQTAAPGRTVTVTNSPLPFGATLTQTASGGTATYRFDWTAGLGQGGATVCFLATDSGGVSSLGNACTVLQPFVAEIIYVSGIVRDFASTHSDMNRAVSSNASPNFVQPLLGADGKPVFAGPAAGVTNFAQWFNDVPGVNTSAVHSVTLSNAFQADTSKFQYAASNFAPPTTDGRHFTWEVHSYINYVPGQSLTFSSSDDMWVFIDGKLVPGWNLHGVHAPKSFTVVLDTLGLLANQTYRMDIFYAHRGATTTPSIQLQMNKASLCVAGDLMTPAVTVPANSFNPNDWSLLGRARVTGGALQPIDAGSVGPTGGAAWFKTLQNLGRGFEVTFDFTINNVVGAFEGFALVLQSSSLTARGGDSGNLGYGSIPKSLAIEFDTRPQAFLFDPANTHISVHSNFDQPNSATETTRSSGGSQLGISLFDPQLPLTFQNGSPHEVRVQYVPGVVSETDPEAPAYGWIRIWLNDNIVPTAQAQVDSNELRKVLDAAGRGYIGFTTSNSGAPTPSGGDLTIRSFTLRTMPVSPALTAVVDPPATRDFIPGLNESFLIQARDACNQKVYYGGNVNDFAIHFNGTPPISGTITDLLDGTYRVNYMPPSPGTWNVNVRMLDSAGVLTHVANSPFTVAYTFDDGDGDGIHDSVDNCPAAPNADQADTDGDASGDACDLDDDNDGVPDTHDAFPLDAAESIDTDGDGTGDHADLDDDGDGVPDTSDAFPLDASESVDTDGDSLGNNEDTDDDGDGVADGDDAFPRNAGESVDTDGDGTGNNADTDDDNDGVADGADRFPLDASESGDHDNDGIGNNADPDDDNDGTPDATDAFPLNPAESADTDGDGTGNNADLDDDGDGQSDAHESQCGSNPLLATDKSLDSDGDNLPDCVDPVTPVPGSPLVTKQGVHASLQSMLASQSASNRRRIEFAMRRVAHSITPALWTDGSHLASHGARVFHLDALALSSLKRVRQASTALTNAMSALVDSDRQLAAIAIADAQSANGNAYWLARAAAALASGDRARAAGRAAHAVELYGSAWAFARRAGRRVPNLFPAANELHEAIDDLSALVPSASRGDAQKLTRAIGDVQAALHASLWSDAAHVSPQRGERVYTQLSQAFEALERVSGEQEAIEAIGDALVAVARGIAETAVTESEAAGEPARKIARARDAIERGDDDQDGGRNAIDYYRQAWNAVR